MLTSDTARSATDVPLAAHRLVACGAAALAGALVYLNALSNPFVYDDHRLILENLSLRNLTAWRAILVHDMTRPLINFSYALDYAIWGGANPFGFHVTNVLIHVVNIVLLFHVAGGLARDLGTSSTGRGAADADRVALAAGLLFAVHPILTQAVGYVSGRSELLCATFFLAAFLSARRAMQGGRARWWAAAAAAWVLSLAAKELAAMFPAVLLAYDQLVFQDTPDARRRRLLRLHVPLVMLATMAAVLRVGVMASVEHPSGTTIHWPFALVELDVFRRYLGLLLLPLNQTIFHAIAPLRSVSQPRAILAVFTVAAYVFLIIRLRRVDGLASFGLAWFALLLIPSAVLVVLDRGEPMAEHRVYLASAGFFMAVGTIAVLIRARIGRLNGVGSRAARRAPAVGLLVVALLCVRTISRNIVWSRPVSLWLEAAEYAPDHWLPRLALGEALHEQGRHEEAIVSLRAALALRPEEALGYAKLGLCLIETGRLVEASATFEGLRRLDPRSPVAAAGLGLVAARTGDSILARRFFVEALELDPRSVPVRQSLAEMAEASDPGEALRLCEEIRQLAPETPGNEECIRRNRARLAAGR